MPLLSLIVAVAENDVIGREGALPWRLSADLQRFKRITMGAPLVMGRRTWDSIGRPLPGRTSIVVTRQAGWRPPFAAVRTADSLEDALAQAAACAQPPPAEIFVIGGEQLYRAALPLADRIHCTRVHARPPGDAFFPPVDWRAWRPSDVQCVAADEHNQYATTFATYCRLPPTDPPPAGASQPAPASQRMPPSACQPGAGPRADGSWRRP
jgi:dihydrofolate reductase